MTGLPGHTPSAGLVALVPYVLSAEARSPSSCLSSPPHVQRLVGEMAAVPRLPSPGRAAILVAVHRAQKVRNLWMLEVLHGRQNAHSVTAGLLKGPQVCLYIISLC